jgi:FkbM family methyltransferase
MKESSFPPIGAVSSPVSANSAWKASPWRLRDSWPAPLSQLWGKGRRFARAWRQYRDGLLFDWFDREYRTGGLAFEVPREHTRLQDRARFRTDTHEMHERRLVEQFMPEDACVLDLGACLGVVSVVANRRLRDSARHVAVEPNPELIPALTRNRDRNAARFRIEQALVSRDSDGTFYVCDCPTMSSAHKPTGRAIRVPVLTVEEIEARHGLRFDALVMDIQGGEHGFFEENRELLKRCRCVVLEFHPHIIGERRCEQSRVLMRQAGLQRAAVSGLVEAWCR